MWQWNLETNQIDVYIGAMSTEPVLDVSEPLTVRYSSNWSKQPYIDSGEESPRVLYTRPVSQGPPMLG
jgi:hypothetical protein